MGSVSPIGVMDPHNSSHSTSSPPPPTLREWVHATNKGTRRFLSHWWHGTSPSHNSSANAKAASSPAPAMIAAICARDTEDLPLEGGTSSQQFCYTCYDSDSGEDENDEELQLELLRQLTMNETDPPTSGSSRASYFMYSSQKSGSAAA